jgi:hypothetical protein
MSDGCKAVSGEGAERSGEMSCPFLREIVMAYCSAYPVKKMVPKDRMTSSCACTCEDFTACSLFRELMARLRSDDGTEARGSGIKEERT